jgi:hypothetical protein
MFKASCCYKYHCEEVRTYDLGKRDICKAEEETWIVETKGQTDCSTKKAICDDVQLAPRPQEAQIVGTVIFDSAHRYDNTRADAEQCSTVLTCVHVRCSFLNASLEVFALIMCFLDHAVFSIS